MQESFKELFKSIAAHTALNKDNIDEFTNDLHDFLLKEFNTHEDYMMLKSKSVDDKVDKLIYQELNPLGVRQDRINSISNKIKRFIN